MIICVGAGERVDIPIRGVPELFFHIRRREVGDDGGWTLELCAASVGPEGGAAEGGGTDGEEALARFDLFRDDPHYHVPASDPKPTPMGVSGSDAALEFALDLLQSQLASMLEKAGRADLVSTVSDSDVEAACEAIRSAAQSTEEPSEFRDLEVSAEMLGQS